MPSKRGWTKEEQEVFSEYVLLGMDTQEAVESMNRDLGSDRSFHSGKYMRRKLRLSPDVVLASLREPSRAALHALHLLPVPSSGQTSDTIGRVVPPKSPEPATSYNDHEPFVFPEMPAHSFESPEEVWRRVSERSERRLEWEKSRHHNRTLLSGGLPVGISFISDQHITTDGSSNLKQMEEDARVVADTPGMYAIMGGDSVNNHIKHRSAILNTASVPSVEYQLFEHYLSMFGENKILAIISGNHDDWSKDSAGVDMIGMIARSNGLLYAPDFVVLSVGLADSSEKGEETSLTTYRIKVRHKYRFESSFNLGHAIKRMWEMDSDDFDVGVLCHKHEGHIETFSKHGQQRWAIRPGSYQEHSVYARRHGYSASVPSCPTVIFNPRERGMIALQNVNVASKVLTSLRSSWHENCNEKW